MKGHGIESGDAAALLSPAALCHIVLKTTAENYSNMVNFYQIFLGGKITYANDRITFMSYDYEHHRLAILHAPGLKYADKSNTGLAHVAFGFHTLGDLATSYEQKKAYGILPTWCVNHGMSTSMYYKDPDGNEVETQVDNYDTVDEAVQFMKGESFAENPIGVDFDAGDFVRRVRSGEDDKAIKERPDIGERLTRGEKSAQSLA